MIRLANVSRTVTSGAEQLTILHPLDLTIPGGQFVAVPLGTDLSTLTYDPSNFNLIPTPEIRAGGTFFIAMVFQDAALVNNWAWLEITTAAPNGHPATINRWAYRPQSEGTLLAGQTAVPEPGTAALGLLAAGALGLRRRRRGNGPACTSSL